MRHCVGRAIRFLYTGLEFPAGRTHRRLGDPVQRGSLAYATRGVCPCGELVRRGAAASIPRTSAVRNRPGASAFFFSDDTTARRPSWRWHGNSVRGAGWKSAGLAPFMISGEMFEYAIGIVRGPAGRFPRPRVPRSSARLHGQPRLLLGPTHGSLAPQLALGRQRRQHWPRLDMAVPARGPRPRAGGCTTAPSSVSAGRPRRGRCFSCERPIEARSLLRRPVFSG